MHASSGAAEALLDSSAFALDAAARRWVVERFEALDDDAKIAQILLPMLPAGADWRERLAGHLAAGVGGVFRFGTETPEFLLESARECERAGIPLLMAGDIEFEETGALGGIGTRFPNQLAVAAAGGEGARRMGAVAAREGRAFGYNWTFTPVADLSVEFRNTLVTTRSFGSDPERVAGLIQDYVTACESEGVASCVKHFPGDGADERDQHVVTTCNRSDLETWRSSFGRVWEAAIGAGARTIMAGHVSLPAYARARGASESEAHLPATLSPWLLRDLLRGELGFDGLIVSDAAEMGGFGSLGRRADLVVACIAAGCDMLLFSAPADAVALRTALGGGILSRDRVDEAVLRVLALKASLGLHRGPRAVREGDPLVDVPVATHRRWADQIARRAITLVRDRDGVLPLKPCRLGLLAPASRPDRAGQAALPPLEIEDDLRGRGFEVVALAPDRPVPVTELDALLVVTAEESRLARLHRRLPWSALQRFPFLMERHFHDLPCILLSLGDPHVLHDAPTWPTVVNGYSPAPVVQRAAVAAICGDHSMIGRSPVDVYAGIAPGEVTADTAVPSAR